jgi:hypothetical protein
MKAKKLLIVLVLTLLALALLLPGAASAKVDNQDHHYGVSGEWSWWGDPDPNSFVVDKVVGISGEGDLPPANVFVHGWEWGAWTGTFVGSSYEPLRAVFHKNGNLWGIITINFTGTVAGVSGEAVIRLTVNGTPEERMHGRWVIISGSGGLDGLHGMGTWMDKTPPDYPTGLADYSGECWLH